MLKTVKEREEAKNYKYLFCLTRSLGTRVIPRPQLTFPLTISTCLKKHSALKNPPVAGS